MAVINEDEANQDEFKKQFREKVRQAPLLCGFGILRHRTSKFTGKKRYKLYMSFTEEQLLQMARNIDPETGFVVLEIAKRKGYQKVKGAHSHFGIIKRIEKTKEGYEDV